MNILHLSDLHLGYSESDSDKETHDKEIRAKIIAATKERLDALRDCLTLSLREKRIDAIIFTGDFFDHSALESDEYPQYIDVGVEFLRSLIAGLNKHGNSIQNHDVLFVPGNHELNRKEPNAQLEKYKQFLQKFHGESFPPEYDTKYWCFVKEFPDVILVGLNSAHFKEKDFGFVELSQINAVLDALDSIKNSKSMRIVLFLHHHVCHYEDRDEEKYDSSTLRDAQTLLSSFLNRNYNIDIILHGHKHNSTNRRILGSYGIREPDKLITVIGCGAIDKKDIGYGSFNHIEVFKLNSPRAFVLTAYVRNGQQFNGEPEIPYPLEKPATPVIKLLDALTRNPKLSERYETLSKSDTCTPADKLMKVFNDTAGALPSTAANLEKNPPYAALLLGAMHYRANKSKGKSEFLGKIRDFIEESLPGDMDSLKEDMQSMLEIGTMYDARNKYKEIRSRHEGNEHHKRYLAVLALGIFLTEIYMTLSENSESFFSLNARKKIDIVLKEGEIATAIEGNTIKILVDEERRALGISVVSNSANAHKIMTLLIKEFEILLLDFEEDFANIGFKVYYVVPKLTKAAASANVSLESYNFSAYIPRLMELLAGEKLYSQTETFSRELIQNSIDAIGLRKRLDKSFDFPGEIFIDLGVRNGNPFFRITDNGTGMTKYILERYFTTIGRSFYKSEDYENLKTTYNPISQFGIGFLSSFLVGKHIVVGTRHYTELEPGLGHLLDIPNIDGCFFIEENGERDVGTDITIYSDPDKNNLDHEKILAYIGMNIQNIPYDISISRSAEKKYCLGKYRAAEDIVTNTARYKLMHFIPLTEEGGIMEGIDMKSYRESEDVRHKHPLGFFFYKKDESLYDPQCTVLLNAGILVDEIGCAVRERLESLPTLGCFDILANLPSSCLELDVSRDAAKGIKNIDFNRLGELLASQLPHDGGKPDSDNRNVPGDIYFRLRPNKPQPALRMEFDSEKHLLTFTKNRGPALGGHASTEARITHHISAVVSIIQHMFDLNPRWGKDLAKLFYLFMNSHDTDRKIKSTANNNGQFEYLLNSIADDFGKISAQAQRLAKRKEASFAETFFKKSNVKITDGLTRFYEEISREIGYPGKRYILMGSVPMRLLDELHKGAIVPYASDIYHLPLEDRLGIISDAASHLALFPFNGRNRAKSLRSHHPLNKAHYGSQRAVVEDGEFSSLTNLLVYLGVAMSFSSILLSMIAQSCFTYAELTKGLALEIPKAEGGPL